MNRYARWSFALALMPLAACASNPPPAPMVAATPPAPPPMSSSDVSFVTTAAQGGMAEVQMAQLAEQKSKSHAVKTFAETMIKDHTTNNDQLKQIATAKGATVPMALTDEQQKTIEMLQADKGRKFDRDYAAAQVQDHQSMLTLMKTEAASGGDADLKSFAAQTAPVVQEHLTMAEKLGAGGHQRMHHPRHSAT